MHMLSSDTNDSKTELERYLSRQKETDEVSNISKDKQEKPYVKKEETPKNTDIDSYDYSEEEDGQW